MPLQVTYVFYKFSHVPEVEVQFYLFCWSLPHQHCRVNKGPGPPLQLFPSTSPLHELTVCLSQFPGEAILVHSSKLCAVSSLCLVAFLHSTNSNLSLKTWIRCCTFVRSSPRTPDKVSYFLLQALATLCSPSLTARLFCNLLSLQVY